MKDSINTALHAALRHLEKKGKHVRMLIEHYSFAFSSIIPSKLITKMLDLGLRMSVLSVDTGLSQQLPTDSETWTPHLDDPDPQHRGVCSAHSAMLCILMTVCLSTLKIGTWNLLTTQLWWDSCQIGTRSSIEMRCRACLNGALITSSAWNKKKNKGKLIIDFRKRRGKLRRLELEGEEVERLLCF